jgi:hypothetical protein
VVVAVTGLVETKVGTTLLLTPSGTVIVAGTVAAAVLLLENDTTAPPGGAGEVRVTVVAAVDPPWTLAGATSTASSVALGGGGGGGGGAVVPVTVRVAVRVAPLYVAEITDVEVELTTLVATEMVAEATPAGTVRVAGTVAAAGLLLVNDTRAPPAGAGAVSVTVAELLVPPATVAGLRLIELSVADGAGAVTVQPDSRTFAGVADPSFTSTVQSAGRV